MAKFTIYSKDGAVRYSGNPQYNGSYMGVDYLEFRSISSPVPIEWEIGDYVDYYRTGMRYRLYSLPQPNKVGRRGEYGASFEYANVQLHAATKELEIAPFRDVVIEDNKIHFSSRASFNTFEDVRGIARRIQESMDELFPGKWRIEVYESDDDDLNALLSEVKDFSMSDSSCMDALSQIYELWKNVGWVHSYDTESNVDVITIGRANVRDNENTSDEYSYGLGRGLTSLRKASANDGEFATRLYVYGSERNITPRYYNNEPIKDAESVHIPNLMLPIDTWGKTDGLPDPRKAFLQADDAIIEKFGIIPRVVRFEGNEHDEIYPSIETLTEEEVRKAMISLGLEDSEYLPPASSHRIDEVYGSSIPDDNGITIDPNGTAILDKLPSTFLIEANSFGFDPMQQAALANESNAVVSMKSGMCAGREFPIVGARWAYGTWFLELERQTDDSLNMAFPNKIYPIEKGDKFVLLNIAMPKYYVLLAEKRLQEAGQKLLNDYSRVSAFYEPSIDPIMITPNTKPLRIGMYMKVYDADIVDAANNTDHVLINTLSIDEASELPMYKVTLREEKRAARNFSAMEDMVEDAKEETKEEVKSVRQFTERRFRSAQETLAMLQSAFKNFSEGINPVTVQTMGLLVGDESLQFKFISPIGTTTSPINIGLSYKSETKTLKVSRQSRIMHMTLGIDSITAPESRGFSDYKRWAMPTWESGTLDDAEKSYYLYARVPIDGTSGEFLLSETSIGMRAESGYYHLLIGILNSEYADTREFVSLYGFTEILPARITTDKIVSADGNAVLDLVEGLLTFGDKVGLSASEGAEENLRIWAGSEADGKDNAPFRVYDNGKVFAALLHLLDGCKIGSGISIEDGEIVIDLPDSDGGKVKMSESGIMLDGYCHASIGNCGGAGVQGFANNAEITCPNVDGGVGVHGGAPNGGYAFWSTSGKFGGLRPNTRVITQSGDVTSRTFLTEVDFSVMVYLSSGVCYLRLPQVPQDGQEYHIESHGATLNILASQPTWMSKTKSVASANTAFTHDGSGILRLKFYKQINQWQCTAI